MLLLNIMRVYLTCVISIFLGFPGGTEVKASTCNVGDLGLIPGSGRSPGEGNGIPLQYSCLENPMDRGARQATVHRVAQSWTQLKRLSTGSNSRISQAWRIVVVPELLQILQCMLSECAQSRGPYTLAGFRVIGYSPGYIAKCITTGSPREWGLGGSID